MPSQPSLKDLLRPVSGPAPSFVERSFIAQRLVGPQRPGVFKACKFRDTRFEAERATRATLAHSLFADCELHGCHFGPATLDLQSVAFRDCKLRDVTFMLGKLAAADFSGSELVNVYFRRANLSDASFRGATLQRVSFERATLTSADFTGCRLVEGDFWGEPPWHDATVPDDLRYAFAIIDHPIQRIDELRHHTAYSDSERNHLATLRNWLVGWRADSSSVLLAYRELDTLFDWATFVWLLKQLRGAA